MWLAGVGAAAAQGNTSPGSTTSEAGRAIAVGAGTTASTTTGTSGGSGEGEGSDASAWSEESSLVRGPLCGTIADETARAICERNTRVE
jgi:hypothetical protein